MAVLVSVVIPAHNRALLMQECITSVARQTYRPIQVVVVDDASSDDIEAAARAVDIPPGITIEVIRLGTNSGPGAAREAGRFAASGDFVAFLDSDDYWGPTFVETLVRVLHDSPAASMAYSTHASFNCLPISGDESVYRTSDQTYTRFLPTVLDHRPWATSACLWRRESTDLIGPWLSAWVWEDYEYDVRAGCLGLEVVHVAEPLSFIRMGRATGLSSREQAETRRLQTAALLAIAADISSSYLSDGPWLSARTDRMLFTNALRNLNLGNRGASVKALRYLSHRGSTTKARLAARLISLLDCGPLPSGFSQRLGYRLRDTCYAEQAGGLTRSD